MSLATIPIYFFFEKPASFLTERTRLKRFIYLIIKAEGRKLQRLNYILCSDKYLLRINKEYLGHSDYTDIISFNLSSRKNEIEGEVYISVDRVKENAKLLNISAKTEILRVVFHGALHLCGFKDKTGKERTTMRLKEDKYLSFFQRFT